MDRYHDDLAVNPIRFVSMGHSGQPGKTGDTSDMFDTQLKQNIAFACYFTPLTAEEIARKLNVPLVYIADELKILYEWGYVDQMDNTKNPRFRTNMFITDCRLFDGTESVMMKEAAKFMCEKLYSKVFEDFERSEDSWGFSCEGNDKNFMKYTLVMLCTNYLYQSEREEGFFEKYAVKRPDGGYFIACADVADDCGEGGGYFPYWSCGVMTRNKEGEDALENIQLDCRFSDRSTLTWRDNLSSDWEYLYEFIKGGLKPEVLAPENYKRLCDKGYIYDNKVQIMTYKDHTAENGGGKDTFRRVICEKVSAEEEVLAYVKDFDKRKYEYRKDKYPEHILPIVAFNSAGALNSSIFVPYLIEEMLERGMLAPLTDLQKKNVFTAIAYKE